MTAEAADARFLDLAIALGRRGLGRVWPNPAVGCVIVQGARVVGRGWTRPGGRPHAETVALAQAGAAARGATAYVSLEPCAHHGKTPPCAEALLAAGVVRVVSALEDPDPRVAGRGHALLAAGGVAVTNGLRAEAARRANEGFLRRVTEGRPHLTLKLAVSVDGRIATATGESQWITGPEARRAVHGMRASHDAVLVGAGTARDDDPSLTIRGLGVTHQPVRIVASRRLDLPTEGRLFNGMEDAPVWLCHGPAADGERQAAWAVQGARFLEVPVHHGRQLDPAEMLQALGAAGLTRVLCEGGGTLAASLLNAGLVDELVTFTAGLGLGAEGRPGLGAMGVDALAAAPRFRLERLRAVGPDAMAVWRPERR
ncbi:bifunctional diaminohydroxyphosphoribosylaminopyrimidine deaminase/5-amino-6-(5-phosphoribosylamino)uracil reductase RibD [Tropicimonas sp. IMCC6043]|uniref:bifunctional diaminohydroxyphosphoribosylaminopyrimidine deaminase/5-amino-6-(5-phosphoribosylamino)uracil reductase RibD n=1 Tax=Tropicimonas sp. IMCC6043 TaxID=2510645 RepID=UPI00101B8BAC|nr:bifunctional diaminohydroxyphosphoribosylaminopyrimidine deaminase/5-amino-6-(5-phosphoribosylamino)uracil reductase RibD [Tropicimonas sp. IMCC6043]RYH08418.1 bifunctional diaminohydroxyphosphoribosylaminopyrimidine deaminase/5-amino-6-(5-phosphoribosylamino)uracil reductase RibD [Tropicimonas sp. IMCC6043]